MGIFSPLLSLSLLYNKCHETLVAQRLSATLGWGFDLKLDSPRESGAAHPAQYNQQNATARALSSLSPCL